MDDPEEKAEDDRYFNEYVTVKLRSNQCMSHDSLYVMGFSVRSGGGGGLCRLYSIISYHSLCLSYLNITRSL